MTNRDDSELDRLRAEERDQFHELNEYSPEAKRAEEDPAPKATPAMVCRCPNPTIEPKCETCGLPPDYGEIPQEDVDGMPWVHVMPPATAVCSGCEKLRQDLTALALEVARLNKSMANLHGKYKRLRDGKETS